LFFTARPPRAGGHGVGRAVAGVILPVLAFAASEAGITHNIVPTFDGGGISSWWALCFAPEVQRPFYPLALWAMAAFAAAETGCRAAWIEAGVLGGCVLSGLFGLLLLPILPVSVLATLLIVGLLGLSPYFSLATYLRSYFEQRRTRREGAESGCFERARAVLGVAGFVCTFSSWVMWLNLTTW
jgi:hypothetical protein